MSTIPEFEKYPFRIEPLPAVEGGGFVIRFPDLPGCMSDGETYAEAIANGREAFQAWVEAQLEDGKPVPRPNEGGEPAKFLQRLPKYLHARLIERAAQEGVSMNSLVTVFVAEGLAMRDAYRRIETPVAGVRDGPHVSEYAPARTELVADSLYVTRERAIDAARPEGIGEFSEVGSGNNIIVFPQHAKSRQASGR